MENETEIFHRQLQALLGIAQSMNACLGRQAVLEQALAAIVRELGYKAALVRTLNAEQGTLDLAAAYGLSQSYIDKGEISLRKSPLDQQVFAGETVALLDPSKEAGLQYPDALALEGLKSALAVPLKLGDTVVGVLRIFTGEPHEFTSDERAFLGGAANLVARALANASLYETFRHVAQQVNSTLEVEQLLHKLLRSLIEELNMRAAAVRLTGPRTQRLHLAAAEGLSKTYLNKGEVRNTDSPIDRQVLGSGQPVMLYDVAAEQAFQYADEAVKEGIRSVLAVPMRVRSEAVGVLRVYSAQPHHFTSEEIALVEALADLSGLALDNARLHEELSARYETAKADWAGWYRYLTMS